MMFSLSQLQQRYQAHQVLVILLSRVYFKTESTEAVNAFIASQNINWQTFYQLIRVNHVRAFVYEVAQTNQIILPANVMQALKADALQINLRSLWQQQMLKRLLNGLSQQAITAIPYKGVNFAAKYYSKASMREGSDIDLMIARKDAFKARNYLLQQGFTHTEDLPHFYQRYLKLFYKDFTFKTQPDALGYSFTVEIQWKLVDHYVGSFEGFDFFRKSLTPQQQSHLGLNPTYDLIALASHHLVREPLAQFKYLIDVAALCQNHNTLINKQLIKKTLLKHGYWCAFSTGMLTIHQLLGTDVDDWSLNPANPDLLLNGCISPQATGKVTVINQKNLHLISQLQQNWLKRIELKLRIGAYYLLPTFFDFKQNPLPPLLFPLYIILRPFRLLRKYTGKPAPPQN